VPIALDEDIAGAAVAGDLQMHFCHADREARFTGLSSVRGSPAIAIRFFDWGS